MTIIIIPSVETWEPIVFRLQKKNNLRYVELMMMVYLIRIVRYYSSYSYDPFLQEKLPLRITNVAINFMNMANACEKEIRSQQEDTEITHWISLRFSTKAVSHDNKLIHSYPANTHIVMSLA